MEATTSILVIFLCSTISFFVLFFTTPYTTGIQLREISKNGIYQWIYMVLSGVGYILYMCLESITNLICTFTGKSRSSRSSVLINTLLFVGAIFFMTRIYESAMDILIAPDVGGLNVGGSSSYDRFSDTLTVFQLFRSYTAADSILGAIKTTVTTCLLYYCATVVFFSIMYGLMSQKIHEFQLLSKHCTKAQIEYLLDFEGDSLDIRQLPHSLLTEACNFVDSIASIKNFQIHGLKSIFLIFILLLSTAKYILSQWELIELDVSFQGLIADLIESAGTLNILLSFLVTWLFTACLCVFSRILYKVLPPRAQETVTRVSQNATKAAARIKEKRNNWSDEHDAVWLETGGQTARQENKILERADLSYQPPSKQSASRQRAASNENEPAKTTPREPQKKNVEKRYPPMEKPEDPKVQKFFLDPEERKAYQQQYEAQKREYSKFKREWDDYVAYIRKNPEALPDFSEMPEWLQKKENRLWWLELQPL